MRMIFGVVLLIGIALAGFAVHLTQNYVNQQKAALAAAQANSAPAVPTVPVFVANRKLSYGEELKLKDIVVAQWPQNALPEGIFQSVEQLFPKDQPGKRYVMRATERFEAVLAVKITEPGKVVGLQSRLEAGQSAFTIKVDGTSGVSGFLRPGNIVDVYWTGMVRAAQGQKQRTVTRLIEDGVKIIAIDQSSNEEVHKASIARTVTVAVTQLQGASLTQAQSTGKLNLSLVGQRDESIAEFIEVDQKQLLGIEEAQPVAQQEAERVCTIRQTKGAEKVNIQIPCPDGS
ncbi:Flp pilus assembly protein CpaB [Planktotalea arctica]|uniref:Flp pilus assembly protein CpaB n=1 Tax=Planktotalea arctica TaxID=1481893 RepID=UPI001593ED1A|nr:Flp pilus assembly protein CpaB [Planktotalea arctica]